MICSGEVCFLFSSFFFFQAEDGIRDLVRSRGLGDVYKRQPAMSRIGQAGRPVGLRVVRVMVILVWF